MTKSTSRGAEALSAITDELERVMEATPRKQRSLAAPIQLMQGVKGHQEVVAELEKLKSEGGAPRELPLDALVPSPLNATPMSEARILGLVENLVGNPLATPIVVRLTTTEDTYEILAGRHRVEAYRRLGRATIAGTVVTHDDDAAERLVFFDNLFAPAFSDYEKFLGFRQRRVSTGQGVEALAKEAGVSKSAVGRLFSFERLPAPAHEMLARRPEAVTALLAEELAKLSTSHGDRVVAAIHELVEQRLSGGRAVAFVLALNQSAIPAPTKFAIRQGKAKFADVVSKGRVVSIRLSQAALDSGAEKAILSALTKLATA